MIAGVQRFRTADHWWWCADFDARTLSGNRAVATRESSSAFDFDTPLGAEALEYVWTHGPAWPAGTLSQVARGLARFGAFLKQSGRRGFSAQAYAAWLEDFAAGDFEEATRRGEATFTRIWIETWLVSRGVVSAGEALSVKRRFKKHFRGFSRRTQDRMREDAVSPQEYVRLVRAIRRELEEGRRLLDAPDTAAEADAAGDHHALPLLPFVLLSGVLLAVRSAEVNAWNVGDIRQRDGEPWLYVHAPNKADGHIWLPETIRRAWEVAEAWMARYRAAPAPGDPLVVVRHPGNGQPVRFDTIWVRCALRVFYRKWFARLDRDGNPVLYRERDGERVPFDLAFRDYRSAAITEMARHERNPQKLRIFARHKSVQTTLTYYVKEAYLEWVAEVTRTLAPGEVSADVAAGAELARIAMRSRIATPAERAAGDGAQARLPGGVCDEALRGIIGCQRARDCRLCRHFRIHSDRRDFFVSELARAERERERASAGANKRDSEVHAGMMALNQAAIDRIDEYFAEMEDDA